MTISSTTRVAGPFTGNGTASTFSFTFKVFSAADLFVQRVTIADGTTTTLVLTTDYTVSLNGNQNTNPGGSITLVAGALASGYTLTITSDIDNVQPTDLTNQGGFYPEVITDSLDRATIQIQQVAATANNALHAPISDGALDMTLPVKELRTGKFLSFSAAGLPIVSDGTVTPDVTSGGNVTITANDAGANVDRDVIFVDNATERMRLKGATGRLGIGTSTPSEALDVVGAAKVSGNLTVNTDTLFVNATGNAVGIGTTAPQRTLSVHRAGSTTASFRLTNSSTGDPASNAGLEVSLSSADAGIVNHATSGTLTLGSNGISALTIQNTGNVTMPASSSLRLNPNGFATNESITFIPAGNVYVQNASATADVFRAYSANSVTATIRSDGRISTTTLSGTGNRLVYSDANGILTNSSSDQTLKTSIATMTDGESLVAGLRPVRFNWIDTDRFGTQREVGLLAQEVQAVVPEVIGTNNDGTLAVDYAKLVSVLIGAVQGLQARVAALEAGS